MSSPTRIRKQSQRISKVVPSDVDYELENDWDDESTETKHPTGKLQDASNNATARGPQKRSLHNSELVTTLLLHYERLMTVFSQRFKKLKKIDDAWTSFSTVWLQNHKDLAEKWVESYSPASTTIPTMHSVTSPTSPSLKKPSTRSREEILKQHITHLENARIGHIVLGEPLPDSLTDALAVFDGVRPPRWLTDKEKVELSKFYSLLNSSVEATINRDYKKLVHLVFNVSVTGFDKDKFAEWIEGVAIEQVFNIVGSLVSQLPYVPPGVGTFLKSFGTIFSASPMILDKFHEIVKESSCFLMILVSVNKSISEAEDYARREQSRTNTIPIKTSNSATEDMRLLLESSIDVYENRIREIQSKMDAWNSAGPAGRFFRVLFKQTPKLEKYAAELHEIRVNVRDEVLLAIGNVSGRTLDAVHDGFRTIEGLEANKSRLEASQLQLVREKRQLEAEKGVVLKEMASALAEKKGLEDDKHRLRNDKRTLESIKTKLLTQKAEIEKDLGLLKNQLELFGKINTLHRDIGHLAALARTALLAAGDKGLGLASNLFHGAVLYRTGHDYILAAIVKIQEIHDLSVRLNIPFEPSLFDHFNWRLTVHAAKFKNKDFPHQNQWNLNFSDDMEWLYGFNGSDVWEPIQVTHFSLDNSCIPLKFDPK